MYEKFFIESMYHLAKVITTLAGITVLITVLGLVVSQFVKKSSACHRLMPHVDNVCEKIVKFVVNIPTPPKSWGKVLVYPFVLLIMASPGLVLLLPDIIRHGIPTVMIVSPCLILAFVIIRITGPAYLDRKNSNG